MEVGTNDNFSMFLIVDGNSLHVNQAFLAGTVPVYMGTRDIQRHLPGKSVIMVSDFESPKHLADYLLVLVHR